MQSQRFRVIALYAIFGICGLTVLGAVITGKSPPEAVYGLLGTLATYLLVGQETRKEPPKPPSKDAIGKPAEPPGDEASQ